MRTLEDGGSPEDMRAIRRELVELDQALTRPYRAMQAARKVPGSHGSAVLLSG